MNCKHRRVTSTRALVYSASIFKTINVPDVLQPKAKMASRRRKLPVRPSSSENNSASVSGQLHELEPHESVTLKYPDNAGNVLSGNFNMIR